jgi:hypothetical protein
MDQRSDYIRQDIDSTRAALDDKLNTLETKARETFDIKHQVAERPWMMLGAAVVTGYVLGNMGSDEPPARWHGQPMVTNDYTQHTVEPSSSHNQSSNSGILSQFDDEISMLKGAAIATITDLLRNAVREYVPAISQHLDKAVQERRFTPTTSPGGSMQSNAEANAINYEAIPKTTSYHGNVAAGQNDADEGIEAEQGRANAIGASHRSP